MKKEKETAQTTDFFHLCQQSCLPRYFPIVVCIHIIVLISQAHEIEIRVSSTLDLCSVPSLCGASWDRSPGLHAFVQEASIKVVGDFVKTVIVQQNLIQQN